MYSNTRRGGSGIEAIEGKQRQQPLQEYNLMEDNTQHPGRVGEARLYVAGSTHPMVQ